MDYTIQINAIKEKDNTHSVVVYVKGLFAESRQDLLVHHLKGIDDWEEGEVCGNPILRVQKWYHLKGINFGPHWSGKYPRWESKDYDDWLLEVQDYLQKKITQIFDDHNLIDNYGIDNININSVLVNYYRNGNNSFRAHKDDEVIFGNNPTIISLSIGSTRKFVLKRSIYNPNCPRSTKLNLNEQELNLDFDLESGDILIMAGSCQKFFCHEVPKMDKETTGERYNLTFRNHKLSSQSDQGSSSS
jgi:alkylated DNA repair dioxygenase AlkB